VLGIGACDGDDVDAAAMQLRDGTFGRVRCTAVSRCGLVNIVTRAKSVIAASRNQLAGVEDSRRIERGLYGA